MASLQWLKECSKPTLLVVTIFLAVVLKFLMQEKLKRRKLNLPPGPAKLPIIGNLHQLGNMPHISLRELAKKYEEYKEKFAYSSCSVPSVSTGYNFVREEEVARLIRRIAESYPGTTNLSKMIGLYANDVLCRVALGTDFSGGGEYDRHGFQKMLDDYQALLGGFSLGDYFPSMEFVHSLTGMKSKLRYTFRRFDQFFDEVITEHRNSKGKQEEKKDLVDILLDIQKDGSSEIPLTMDNIKAVILDMFAAGTDTTFIILDWAMTELIMNPNAMEKAQDEVRGVVGDRKVVQESDLPRLNYMKAVIKEIFRLHPPSPVLLPRESLEDVIIDGYNIPAKTRIYVNVWGMGRDPELWENPETFEPERFIGSGIDFKGQDFELIPFGAGRRSCPAITFGTAAIEIALAQLLHSFDWKLPPGLEAMDVDNTEAFGISMHRTVPLHVVAKPHFD
ncbi:CYTOCHROME P450 FAMILY 71 PROTEIN [Salix viminalis]|uniref:CYTOCHROME P450 FAMILY 71 PROTEIN n=1 Tax=Salix viminalis TaxID=40686 RepID=A0A9Q0NM28_SALVM|nr:CYTOCHROME P450 FAMILY 71 PROTEIN [Salix viminalis]